MAMKREETILVRFLRTVSPYNAGETAGFSPKEADRYIKGKWPAAVALTKKEVEEVRSRHTRIPPKRGEIHGGVRTTDVNQNDKFVQDKPAVKARRAPPKRTPKRKANGGS